MTSNLAAIAGACALAFAATGVHAFKLKALTADEKIPIVNRQAQGFLQLFTSDVHERITKRAYEVAGVALPEEVMTGMRWNDNPPALRLESVLRVDRLALETLSRREMSITALRSHFGDMQFLHAMAPRVAEPATETREKILRWCEFAYRVARGEIEAGTNVHRLAAQPLTLDPATARWLGELFASPEKKLWTVQDLFVAGQGSVRLVAFGTFMHLVEDSYSASHVRRVSRRVQANGCPSYDATDPIVEFHTYGEQDTEKHAVCDDAPDWLESPRPGSPIDPMASLVRAFSEGKNWAVVKPILEQQVFRLAPRTYPAHAGHCFERGNEAMENEHARPAPTALEASCREGD